MQTKRERLEVNSHFFEFLRLLSSSVQNSEGGGYLVQLPSTYFVNYLFGKIAIIFRQIESYLDPIHYRT
jgi:hypothetical protein